MQVAAIFGVLNLLPSKRKSRQVPKPNMLVKGNLGCSYAANHVGRSIVECSWKSRAFHCACG